MKSLCPRLTYFMVIVSLLQSLHISDPQKSHLDYIIIGGGLSGLQAASLLLTNNISNFRVFEAQDHFGGKVIGDYLRQIPEVTSQKWWEPIIMKQEVIKIGGIQMDHYQVLIREVIKDLGIQLDVNDGQKSDTFLYHGKSYIQDHLNESEEYSQFDFNQEVGQEARRVFYTMKNDSKIYGQAMDRAKVNLTDQDAKILSHYSKLSFQDYVQDLEIEFDLIQSMLYSRIEMMNSLKLEDSSAEVLMKTLHQTGDLWIIGQNYGILESKKSYEIKGHPNLVIKRFVEQINKLNKDILKLNHEVVQIDNSNYEQQEFKVKVKIDGKIETFTTSQVISAVPFRILASLKVAKMSEAKKYILQNLQVGRYLKTNIATKNSFSYFMRNPRYSNNISTVGQMSSEYLSDVYYDPFTNLGGMTYYIPQRSFDQFSAKTKEERIDYITKLTIELLNLDLDSQKIKRNLENMAYFESKTIHDNPFLKGTWGETQKVGTFAHVIEHFKQSPHKVLERDEFGIVYIGADHSALHCTQMDGAVIVARAKIHKLINKTDKYRHYYEKYYP